MEKEKVQQDEKAEEEKTKKEETEEKVKEKVSEEPKKNEKNNSKKKKSTAVLIVCILVMSVAIVGVAAVLKWKDSQREVTIQTTKKKPVEKNDYRLSGNGLENFDLYFLQLENPSKNMVYSPLSIKYALAMLNEGTAGDSHEQIATVIGDYKAKKYNNNDHMSFGNAMFIRNTFQKNIQESYTKTLKEKYGADVIVDPFESAQPLNDWISGKTFKLIDKLLSDDEVKNGNFFLINALAIDMKWKNQIHCATGSMNTVPCYKDGRTSIYYNHEKLPGSDMAYSYVSYPYTSEDDFPALAFDGKGDVKSADVFATFNRYDAVKEIGEDRIRKEVGDAYREWLEKEKSSNSWEYQYAEKDVNKYLDEYVKSLDENFGKEEHSTDFMIYDDDNVKAFAKDLQEYDGTTLQYIGIMPKNDSLSNYVNNTNSSEIKNVISGLKELKADNFRDGVVTFIEGNIPMFKYDYELDLNKDLKKLGIEDIFDVNKSDFSRMLKDESQVINAKHKATIEFSNEGIKASAVTSMGGYGSSGGGFDYLYEIPVEEIDITFDKPYLYLIRDKATGEIWFVGTVYEPIPKN